MAAIIVIFVVAALAVLSELGVNITPLIAAVSIFGLALSFGSQTLVRDIVSGIFYLADDAFRVGEYIDCGKAKGTVEDFTLRSIRLRHQNGQIYTIPFGQLAARSTKRRPAQRRQPSVIQVPRHRHCAQSSASIYWRR
jgi:small-conductance mechanosensitive channel